MRTTATPPIGSDRNAPLEDIQMFTLKDLMSRNFQWAAPEDQINDIAKKMDVLNVSDLPICEKGRIIGMVSRTRIISLKKTSGTAMDPVKACEAMARDITCGAESLDVKVAIRIMREKKLRTMPVVDSGNHLIGIFQLGM
jgi:predicted transcriptional regulator